MKDVLLDYSDEMFYYRRLAVEVTLARVTMVTDPTGNRRAQ